MAKSADSIRRGLEQAVEHAQRNGPARRADPGTRGLTVETCDQGHQAIAFAGTCPLCRVKARADVHGSRPLAEGVGIYAADLERLLRARYSGSAV